MVGKGRHPNIYPTKAALLPLALPKKQFCCPFLLKLHRHVKYGQRLDPDSSGPCGVHWQGIKGAAVVILLQTLDNAANGHFRECPWGEIFAARNRKTAVVNRPLLDQIILSDHKWISISLQLL
jgi:hypothetical protein